MGTFRRRYYDIFSRYYDAFVALHSRDTRGGLRRFFSSKVPAGEGDFILDICSGTGTLLQYLRQKVGEKGLVVGTDFSMGMLRVSREKSRAYPNILVVQSDAAYLPFGEDSFDAVTCSYAFYELKEETQDRALREIVRVLKPGKAFLIMEHDMPDSPLIRTLLYIRLFSMGARRAFSILRHEKDILKRYFSSVEKIETASKRSKIMVCRN